VTSSAWPQHGEAQSIIEACAPARRRAPGTGEEEWGEDGEGTLGVISSLGARR